MATPSSHVDGTTFLTPKDRLDREVSVESSTSGGSRSNMDDSETSRRSRARKQRQTRKSTQPVPADLLEQLSKHDRELELAEELKTTSSSSVDDATDGPAPKDGDSGKKQQPRRVTMSTYRPSARPTSHITAESVAPTWPPKANVGEDKAKVAEGKGKAVAEAPQQKPSELKKKKKKKLDDENSVINIATKSTSSSAPYATPSSKDTPHKHARSKSMPSASAYNDDSSSTSPSMLHPRTKSTTRRRPREKRRSTGIVTEAGEGEEIPEGLENLVRRSGGDGEAVTVSSASDESLLILEDGSALSVEVASLHSQLEEERAKRLKLEKGKEKLDRELEESKAKNLALHRRYQDATRAYDQERRENEMKDVRLQEMENHSKQLQELKHENQRMKDENSALIRVIGKLSRSPLPQQHT